MSFLGENMYSVGLNIVSLLQVGVTSLLHSLAEVKSGFVSEGFEAHHS